jgi:4-cresol dehydrogenase (hydroxylating)
VLCVISISYDREVAGEDAQAMRCYEELARRCSEGGFYPYRLGIQSMPRVLGESGYKGLIRRLKDAVDPNGILAPGRYDESVEYKAESNEKQLSRGATA